MKLQSVKLAIPLLGVLLWVLSIHAGIFSDANTQYFLLTQSESLLPDSHVSINLKPDSKALNILDHITQKDINDTVNFASHVIGFMKRFENNLMGSNIKVNDGTPSHGMLISFGPEPEAVNRGKDALIALKATNQLMNQFCDRLSKANSRPISYKECGKLMSRFTFHGTSIGQSCEILNFPCEDSQYHTPYRSINGSCNNFEKGHKGESFTGYSRLLYADYSDGVQELRRSVMRKPLPNARHVVSSLVKYGNKPSQTLTLALMQWSQFIEHDLSRSATAAPFHTENPIECCSHNGDNLSPRFVHPFCSPISVSNDESYSKQGVRCLSFVRSIPAIRPDCSLGASDQVNQATHYLDGSQIYGSTSAKSAELRSFEGGKLATSTHGQRTYLPLSKNPTRDCQIFSKNSLCFTSGDARVNFQPQLTAMHTLWYREHNRIAEELLKLNNHWDDEMLFQEARRLVIAEMQKITYGEWLQAILGKVIQQKILSQSSYSKKTDASVSNSFATAAMRSVKSLSDGKPKLYDEDRVANESIFMRNYFNNPTVLKQHGVLDALIRGLTTQLSQKLDIYYAEDLINRLYTNGRFGFDVLSFDVQRGRDHGLPPYNDYRTLCGLKRAKRFTDFMDVMSQEDVNALSHVYASPQDVDLIIGGLLEKSSSDALFGPTFSCIVADQMFRTRKGDRYFYDNQNQRKPFTNKQLDQINKVSLARIMCDNGDNIKKMQPRVFEKIDSSNPLYDCASEQIPKVDLRYWQEFKTNCFNC